MDDSRCRAFFTQPAQVYHRRYEALRAVFVEGRAAKEVAEQFGFAYSSLRQLIYEFRQQRTDPSAASPFFANQTSVARSARPAPARPRKSPTWPTAANWCCRPVNRCG